MKKNVRRLALRPETVKILTKGQQRGANGGYNEDPSGGSGTFTATVNCPTVAPCDTSWTAPSNAENPSCKTRCI